MDSIQILFYFAIGGVSLLFCYCIWFAFTRYYRYNNEVNQSLITKKQKTYDKNITTIDEYNEYNEFYY